MAKTYKVAIDAGHGVDFIKGGRRRHDPGAVMPNTSFTEEKFAGKVESYMQKLAAPFERYGLKFVYTSNEMDRHGTYSSQKASLNARKDYAKAQGADEFISLHFDARSTKRKGARVHAYDANDKKLARDILKDLASANKSIIDDGLGVGHNKRVLFYRKEMPSVLIEFGDKTESVLASSRYQETVARALVLSAVERAIENGVQIPNHLVESLKRDYRLAQRTNILPGEATIAQKHEVEQKPQIVQRQKETQESKPKRAEPEFNMTPLEQLIAARLAFPDLDISKVDPKGNIYAKGQGGQAIATFLESGKIWVGKDFRTDGKVFADNAILAIKESLDADINITRIDRGNVYAEGYGNKAVLTLMESGRLYVSPEARSSISSGKTAVDFGNDKFASVIKGRGANNFNSEVHDIIQGLKSSGAQYFVDNSNKATMPSVESIGQNQSLAFV